MAEPMLSVYNINVWYGAIHAIKDISFNVNEGEIVALIGANGAGKSTTLKTVSGLLRPRPAPSSLWARTLLIRPLISWLVRARSGSRGSSRLFADDGRGEPGDGCLYAAQVHGGSGPGARLRAVPAPEGTSSLGRRHPFGRRAADARYGARPMSNPKLLMLDEPSMGLAPILIEQIFQIVEDLHKAGTTVLLVEQNAQMALSIATRGYVLETGKITMTGTGQELLHDDNVRKAYLG